MRSPRCRVFAAAAVLGMVVACARGLAAQQTEALRLIAPDGADRTVVGVGLHRGYAAVPFRVLERLGWTVVSTEDGALARRPGHRVLVRVRTPLFHWDEQLLQLTHEPYRIGDELWIPLQLLTDFLPERAPEEYAFQSEALALHALTEEAWSGPALRASVANPPPQPQSPGPIPIRMVVLDPGHGGEDPGARGPGGLREKDVALSIALALARELETRPDTEVHLTRSTDRGVPPWERGAWATRTKGDRPGIFISIHANSGTSLAARGFETYFLSEARTEHERRVAELENAPFLAMENAPTGDDPGLDFILRDLGTLDHQHWSALLAELVQARLAPVHPGPNRGVKQAPLAVVTNALMPAVLIEVGFISNRAEERLLASSGFHADAALAIAAAVDDFFERYPPRTVIGGAP